MSEIMQIIWDFCSNNFHIFGWVGLVVTVGRLAWIISKNVNSFLDNAAESQERQIKMEATVEALATNHLPHIQAAVDETNQRTDNLIEEIRGLRRDLLQLAVSRK